MLSRGLLGGHWCGRGRRSAPGDFRAHSPRFSGANLAHNLALVERLRARRRTSSARSVAQLAIAWVLARGEDIVALVGARTPRARSPTRSARSTSTLDAATLARSSEAFAAGRRGRRAATREAGMAQLDSER